MWERLLIRQKYFTLCCASSVKHANCHQTTMLNSSVKAASYARQSVFAHSFVLSVSHSIIHSFTIRSFVCLFVCSVTQSSIHSCIHSFVQSRCVFPQVQVHTGLSSFLYEVLFWQSAHQQRTKCCQAIISITTHFSCVCSLHP
jgi:hypothetical protein